MHPTAISHKFDDSFLLLDEEFDLEEDDIALEPLPGVAPPANEIGWEDQLDNGEEMSL